MSTSGSTSTSDSDGDWQHRFAEYVRTSMVNNVRLDWREHNCCSWASGAVQAVTGIDYYTKWGFSRKANKANKVSPLTLRRKLRKASPEGTLDGLLRQHFPYTSAGFARRGDLALLPTHRLRNLDDHFPEALGVVDAGFIWVLGIHGPDRVPLSKALKFYTVWPK